MFLSNPSNLSTARGCQNRTGPSVSATLRSQTYFETVFAAACSARFFHTEHSGLQCSRWKKTCTISCTQAVNRQKGTARLGSTTDCCLRHADPSRVSLGMLQVQAVKSARFSSEPCFYPSTSDMRMREAITNISKQYHQHGARSNAGQPMADICEKCYNPHAPAQPLGQDRCTVLTPMLKGEISADFLKSRWTRRLQIVAERPSA